MGKNTTKTDVHPGSPRERERGLFGFPNFSFQLSQVGSLQDISMIVAMRTLL